MQTSTISSEQSASADSGIVCATAAMAAAGCALGTATIMAMKFGTHPFGQQLTGFQVLSSLILPLFASFIPVVVMFFVGGKSEDHGSH